MNDKLLNELLKVLLRVQSVLCRNSYLSQTMDKSLLKIINRLKLDNSTVEFRFTSLKVERLPPRLLDYRSSICIPCTWSWVRTSGEEESHTRMKWRSSAYRFLIVSDINRFMILIKKFIISSFCADVMCQTELMHICVRFCVNHNRLTCMTICNCVVQGHTNIRNTVIQNAAII